MKMIFSLCISILILNSCNVYRNPSSNSVSSGNSSISSESNEFAALMIKDKLDKNQRSAAVVNQLLNDETTDKIAALVFENKTNCNIIVRIYGTKNYTLPINKNDKNFLIVDKGNYIFTSNFCVAKYNVRKKIVESVTVTLSEH